MNKEAQLDLEQYEADNQAIIQQLIDAEDGPCKNASAASQDMIRRRIRENGFSRKILPPKQVSNQDLNRLPDTELPVTVEDMEADQPGAKSISFNDTPDTAFYRGDKFIVIFNKITSPEFTKNVDELRTYKMDLRQVVTDNSLKDIQTEEDLTFINTVDEIVGSPSGVGASGLQQNFAITGGITRTTYRQTLSYLENRYLNNGCFLLNTPVVSWWRRSSPHRFFDTISRLVCDSFAVISNSLRVLISHSRNSSSEIEFCLAFESPSGS